MHNAAFAALGLDWRYLAFEVHPDDLRSALAGARTMGFIGLNLTVPHKLIAVEMMDVLDESARAWGAVNTVRFEARDEKGEWQPLHHFPDSVPREVRAHGFNTDADGLLQSLRSDLEVELAGAKVLVLGAGGAGRVAALKLAEQGVSELFLVNRTADKAASLGQEVGSRYPKVKVSTNLPKLAVDLLVNATSLGLKPGDGMPLNTKEFDLRNARAVCDMIYRPAETPLLKAAKAAGCRTTNGLGMLLYQGVRAQEIWTGRKPPVEIMREAAISNIYGSGHNI
jgi:shikimate dehydrogenase